MVLGESAAYAACMAIDENKPVQEVGYPALRKKLLEAKQVLEYKAPPKKR